MFGALPRLSISGWFHAADPPDGSDLASLKQVMSKGDNDAPFTSIPESIFNECTPDTKEAKSEEEELDEFKLSTSDMNILKQYLNSEYLRPENMKKIRQTFIEDSSIQLHDFLVDDVWTLLTEATYKADIEDELGGGVIPSKYLVGVGHNWSCVGPPHKHRYLRYNSASEPKSNGEDSGALISDIRQHLFRSPSFHRYLFKITNMQVRSYRDEIRRFRPGLDYTVAHHGIDSVAIGTHLWRFVVIFFTCRDFG